MMRDDNRKANRWGLAAALAAWLAAIPALVAAAEPAESPWRVSVAVGYGQRGNPLINADDIDLAVDLDIGWFGERFFFDNGDLGFTLSDTDRATVNLVARINSDRLFFSKTNTRLITLGEVGTLFGTPIDPATADQLVTLEVPDRDYAVELGVEYLAGGPWGNLQLSAHHDVSGTHDGFQVYLDYGYGFGAGRWFFELSGGAAYKSEKLNDYYWGVAPGEAGVALPAYEAGSGINVHAKVLAGYLITERWSFAAALQFEWLNDEAADSPIVDERAVPGFFAGLRYAF